MLKVQNNEKKEITYDLIQTVYKEFNKGNFLCVYSGHVNACIESDYYCV